MNTNTINSCVTRHDWIWLMNERDMIESIISDIRNRINLSLSQADKEKLEEQIRLHQDILDYIYEMKLKFFNK